MVADRRGAARSARRSTTRCAATCTTSTASCSTPCPSWCARSSAASARRRPTSRRCASRAGRAATWTATPAYRRHVHRAPSTCTGALAVRLLRDRVERLASRYSQSETEMAAGRAALEASLRRDARADARGHAPARRPPPPRAGAGQAQLHLRAAAGQRRAARQPARLPRAPTSSGATSSWCATRPAAEPVADGAIKDLLRQVSAFGLHLARLDVRLAADAIAASVRRDLPRPRRRRRARAAAHPRRAHRRAAHPDQFGPICTPTEALHALSAAARRYARRRRHAGHLDGPRGHRRPRRAVARPPRRPRRPGRAAAAHHAAVRDAGRARAGARDDGRAVRRPGLPRAPGPPRRPPGDHARLLGLGQGRRLPHQPVGDLPRPGAARRAGRPSTASRSRSSTAAAARPRAAARPPTRRSSPSRRARSTAACASPSRAR